MMKKILIFSAVFLFLMGISIFLLPNYINPQSPVNSFEECVKGNNIILELYPPQCRTKNGMIFTQDIGNELELSDIILVQSPRPNQTITSPLTIKGKARGVWFFEAEFTAILVDSKNNTLNRAILRADGEWMTEDFVPFSGILNFDTTEKSGKLILEKANPSGLEENNQKLIIPIEFNSKQYN